MHFSLGVYQVNIIQLDMIKCRYTGRQWEKMGAGKKYLLYLLQRLTKDMRTK